MPTPTGILSMPPCASTFVSEAQAFRHVVTFLRRDVGNEAAFSAAVALTQADAPAFVTTPLGDVVKTPHAYAITIGD